MKLFRLYAVVCAAMLVGSCDPTTQDGSDCRARVVALELEVASINEQVDRLQQRVNEIEREYTALRHGLGVRPSGVVLP